MKVALLFCVLVTVCLPGVSEASGPGQARLVTNLVEVLEYVDAFSKTLNIDVPQPLTTNDVSWSTGCRGDCIVVGLRIRERFAFVFDVRHHLINYFADRRYSMVDLWREEDIKPLIRPSKISAKQALEMARQCLVKLGYTEDKLLPLLPPKVHQWKWKPPGAWLGNPLPFFTVEWRWKNNPDFQYCRIEIDGFRQKVTEFSIMYPSRDIFPPDPPTPR
jgi:hypothetical protein